MTYPAQPLEYGVPRQSGRPSLVTAVGVMSIVVGGLGAVIGLWSTFSTAMMLFVAQMAPATLPPSPPPPATTAPAATTTPAALTTMNVTATSWSATYTPAGGGPAVVTTTATPNPFAGMSRWALMAVVLLSLLGLVLALALVGLGIMVLRDSRRALAMHRWYAAVKIPLVLLSAAATLWLNWSMARAMTATMAATPQPPGSAPLPQWSNAAMFAMMSITTVFWVAVGLAYPVALIFVLRSRTVREYCSAVRD